MDDEFSIKSASPIDADDGFDAPAPVRAPDVSAPAISAKNLAAKSQGPQSWGEKYGVKAAHFFRDIFMNYIVNFIGSSIITYNWETSNVGKKVNGWIHDKAGGSKIKGFVYGYCTRAQFLMMGGRALLPFMHWTNNHRLRYEFGFAHKLDKLQMTLGFGDETTKHHIQEAARVSQLISVGDHHRLAHTAVHCDLTDNDRALLEKYRIDENTLQFKEKPRSWWQTIKARLGGEACTLTMAVAMGVSSTVGEKYPAVHFNERVEKPIGKWLGNNLVKKIPFAANLKDPSKFGEFFVDEMAFTAASKFGYDKMEKRQIAQREKAEQQAEQFTERTEKHDAPQEKWRSKSKPVTHSGHAEHAHRPTTHVARHEKERSEAELNPAGAGIGS